MGPGHGEWHHGQVPDPAQRGLTVWLTGLPGSGKTTSAASLAARLSLASRASVVLDGDELRTGISSDLGFSAEDRDENVRRAGEIALLLASQGSIVIVSLVSPRRAARDAVRARHAAAAISFVEVHVAAPLAVCERRDPKSLYRRARSGDLAQVTGVDDPYEPPTDPELVLATDLLDVQQSGAALASVVLGALG